MSRSLVRNAFYNLLRGGTSAIVALVLPPILARLLPESNYGTWVLVLQISAYVNFFDFGIQTAVGRYVARANELDDTVARERSLGSALLMLIAAGTLGFLINGAFSLSLPSLFREIPPGLIGDSQFAVFLTGSVLAIGVVFSLYSGLFVGFHRYDLPAITVGGGKILGACIIILLAWFTGNILVMSIGLAFANLISYIALILSARNVFPEAKVSLRNWHLPTLKELSSYCISLSVWSVATLLITGLDTTIVGIYEFKSVAYYSIAASLITFITGMQYAVFNALIPTAAAASARNESEMLGSLLLSTTRYGMLSLLITGLPLILFASPILVIWVGTDYAIHTTTILKILVIANIIRLSALPYALLLVGSGQQRLIIISPILEAISNLVFSLLLGYLMGAVGVAIGTLIGGITGILCNIFYNMPKTTQIAVSRWHYIQTGLLLPLACFCPVVLLVLINEIYTIFYPLVVFLWLFTICVSFFLIWVYCIKYQERMKILLVIEKKLLNRFSTIHNV